MADRGALPEKRAGERRPGAPLERGESSGKPRSLFVPALFTCIGVVLLSGLGIWQLERKNWKEGLIAAISARVDAPPAQFPPEAAWSVLAPETDEYRHVRLDGHFLNDKEAHLQANLVSSGMDDGALGYDILTPLELPNGALVLVNRGFVPLDKKDASARRESEIEGKTLVTGLIRFPQARPWFAPKDDAANNIWFSRDPTLIAKAYGLERVAPVIVDADEATDKNTLPRGGQTRIMLPNDHLQYALTWFGLALALLCIFISYAVRRTREAPS
ncbi:MAG: SURF1 family protein [Hyphomicrobiales bacterium]|nr:SURF1 family protein [Hyphomicrobiales bacterium]